MTFVFSFSVFRSTGLDADQASSFNRSLLCPQLSTQTLMCKNLTFPTWDIVFDNKGAWQTKGNLLNLLEATYLLWACHL